MLKKFLLLSLSALAFSSANAGCWGEGFGIGAFTGFATGMITNGIANCMAQRRQPAPVYVVQEQPVIREKTYIIDKTEEPKPRTVTHFQHIQSENKRKELALKEKELAIQQKKVELELIKAEKELIKEKNKKIELEVKQKELEIQNKQVNIKLIKNQEEFLKEKK